MEYFQVSESTVRREMKSGKLKSYKQGQQRRTTLEWVLEYEAELIASSMKGDLK
ncbi:hypothetical protein GOL43_33465 [Sinorhizobium medicae]|nr:hypothetical protein [Sinorhizobium medicae]